MLALSESFETTYARLVLGVREHARMMELLEKHEGKIPELANLARSLFSIPYEHLLSSVDLALIAYGYVKGDREWSIEVIHASAYGAETTAYPLELPEDEGALKVLRAFLGYGKGKRKGKGL